MNQGSRGAVQLVGFRDKDGTVRVTFRKSPRSDGWFIFYFKFKGSVRDFEEVLDHGRVERYGVMGVMGKYGIPGRYRL